MARVLVLDDDVTIAVMVAEIVEFVGHEPLIESSPVEAVAKHVRAGVAAAIIDFHLPGLSGVEVLAAFADHSPNTRRILISASPNEPEIKAGVADGTVQRLISKPFQIAHIRSALEWL